MILLRGPSLYPSPLPVLATRCAEHHQKARQGPHVHSQMLRGHPQDAAALRDQGAHKRAEYIRGRVCGGKSAVQLSGVTAFQKVAVRGRCTVGGGPAFTQDSVRIIWNAAAFASAVRGRWPRGAWLPWRANADLCCGIATYRSEAVIASDPAANKAPCSRRFVIFAVVRGAIKAPKGQIRARGSHRRPWSGTGSAVQSDAVALRPRSPWHLVRGSRHRPR